MGTGAPEVAPAHSEVRRAAKSLMERRVETFGTLHPLEPSRARLEREFAALGSPRSVVFAGRWTQRDGREVYEATFAPQRRTRWFLNAMSIVLSSLVASSAWVLYAAEEGAPLKFLLPLGTVLSVFAFPLVVAMLASHREADESRIRRAIRRALEDADRGYPPPQKWDDED